MENKAVVRRERIETSLLILFLTALLGTGARAADAPADWRDQVVYFLMTDRFDNGDPRNDDQGHGEFNPRDGSFYSGGDFAGVRRRLDYIQGLGATAAWLTPPVANVWYDSLLKSAGYHGYWAENFERVDAHLGTIEDYAGLSADLHARGMRLIQDIVVNHGGDFFSYEGAHDPKDPAKNFRLKRGMAPARPSLSPFSMNDAANPEHRRAAIYHWTPDIRDFKDETERRTHQMSGLDDFNTSSPAVRDALRRSHGFWIKAAGVDAFRIDTAQYVEHDFLRDFVHSTSTAAPGALVLARSLGRRDFLTFGEVWTNATPFSDKEDRVIASYLGAADKPELGAMLNFPLAMDLRAVFAHGASPALLKYRLGSLGRSYRGGRAAANFIDNHDMTRFLVEGTEAGLVQGLAVLMTIPGIPVIYAGTEQGFKESRASLFAGGFGSGGRDRFDAAHPLYKTIRELADLRKRHELFRRGTVVPLYGAEGSAGPLAYRVDHGRDRALVLLNSSDEEALLPELRTGLAQGLLLENVFSRGFADKEARIGKDGALSLRLPGRGVAVLMSTGRTAALARTRASLAITGLRGNPTLSKTAVISGTSEGVSEAALVIDGRLSRPIPVRPGPDGRWSAELDPSSLPDGPHSVVAMDSSSPELTLSGRRAFQVAVPWTLERSVDDPAGDDHGPSGAYRYPSTPGFEGRADIGGISLYRRGAGAKLVVRMVNGLSDAWNPPLGFDHVSFSVFIGLPGGKTRAFALPALDASMPHESGWHYGAFAGGWKAALYGAEGATAASQGVPIQPAPGVRADKKRGEVEFIFDPDAFKDVRSFDGAWFYVATWDYDGGDGSMRPLAPAAGAYSFGGGKAGDPRIMDDVRVFPANR